MKFNVGDRVWIGKLKNKFIITDIDKRILHYKHETLNWTGKILIEYADLHQTAQTMFEALDYENQGGDEWEHRVTKKHIYFDCEQTISCYKYQAKVPTAIPQEITMKELKAVIQMCVEKGWL